MKLQITENFLLDLYNYTEKIDSTFNIFSSRTMKEVCYPDLYDLKRQYEKRKTKQQFCQLVYYLKKNGYIKIKDLKQNKGVILTKKGAEKVLKVKLKMKDGQKRSDGRWQMIIFDVPEKKRQLRDLLRDNLRILKYTMLQQSIWVCPYNVQKETEFILRKYSLDPYVKLFLIEEIEL